MRSLLMIVAACLLTVFSVWGRKKVVLRAEPVETDTLQITSVDDTIAPTLMLLPIEVNVDSIMEHKEEEELHSLPNTVLASEVEEITEDMSILGASVANVERMYRFVLTRNPNFDRAIAEAFYELGKVYGIRGDVALCQSLIETGWFLFTGGTAVTPDQHNYCGLGVTRLGMKGHSFDSIELGVRAQLQHLYAYASKKSLPHGEKIVDPRFNLVKRGVATSWKELSGRWAANKQYAVSIMRVYRQMLEYNM